MCSNTIFIAAVIGIASTSPTAPHRNPQISSETVTARGFSCKRLPSIFGYSTFSAIRWNETTPTATASIPAGFRTAMPAISGGAIASGTPRYGIRLTKPLISPTKYQ
jgi:hypothetical protein